MVPTASMTSVECCTARPRYTKFINTCVATSVLVMILKIVPDLLKCEHFHFERTSQRRTLGIIHVSSVLSLSQRCVYWSKSWIDYTFAWLGLSTFKAELHYQTIGCVNSGSAVSGSNDNLKLEAATKSTPRTGYCRYIRSKSARAHWH